jgi:hypothetical protein
MLLHFDYIPYLWTFWKMNGESRKKIKNKVNMFMKTFLGRAGEGLQPLFHNDGEDVVCIKFMSVSNVLQEDIFVGLIFKRGNQELSLLKEVRIPKGKSLLLGASDSSFLNLEGGDGLWLSCSVEMGADLVFSYEFTKNNINFSSSSSSYHQPQESSLNIHFNKPEYGAGVLSSAEAIPPWLLVSPDVSFDVLDEKIGEAAAPGLVQAIYSEETNVFSVVLDPSYQPSESQKASFQIRLNDPRHALFNKRFVLSSRGPYNAFFDLPKPIGGMYRENLTEDTIDYLLSWIRSYLDVYEFVDPMAAWPEFNPPHPSQIGDAFNPLQHALHKFVEANDLWGLSLSDVRVEIARDFAQFRSYALDRQLLVSFFNIGSPQLVDMDDPQSALRAMSRAAINIDGQNFLGVSKEVWNCIYNSGLYQSTTGGGSDDLLDPVGTGDSDFNCRSFTESMVLLLRQQLKSICPNAKVGLLPVPRHVIVWVELNGEPGSCCEGELFIEATSSLPKAYDSFESYCAANADLMSPCFGEKMAPNWDFDSGEPGYGQTRWSRNKQQMQRIEEIVCGCLKGGSFPSGTPESNIRQRCLNGTFGEWFKNSYDCTPENMNPSSGHEIDGVPQLITCDKYFCNGLECVEDPAGNFTKEQCEKFCIEGYVCAGCPGELSGLFEPTERGGCVSDSRSSDPYKFETEEECEQNCRSCSSSSSARKKNPCVDIKTYKDLCSSFQTPTVVPDPEAEGGERCECVCDVLDEADLKSAKEYCMSIRARFSPHECKCVSKGGLWVCTLRVFDGVAVYRGCVQAGMFSGVVGEDTKEDCEKYGCEEIWRCNEWGVCVITDPDDPDGKTLYDCERTCESPEDFCSSSFSSECPPGVEYNARECECCPPELPFYCPHTRACQSCPDDFEVEPYLLKSRRGCYCLCEEESLKEECESKKIVDGKPAFTASVLGALDCACKCILDDAQCEAEFGPDFYADQEDCECKEKPFICRLLATEHGGETNSCIRSNPKFAPGASQYFTQEDCDEFCVYGSWCTDSGDCISGTREENLKDSENYPFKQGIDCSDIDCNKYCIFSWSAKYDCNVGSVVILNENPFNFCYPKSHIENNNAWLEDFDCYYSFNQISDFPCVQNGDCAGVLAPPTPGGLEELGPGECCKSSSSSSRECTPENAPDCGQGVTYNPNTCECCPEGTVYDREAGSCIETDTDTDTGSDECQTDEDCLGNERCLEGFDGYRVCVEVDTDTDEECPPGQQRCSDPPYDCVPCDYEKGEGPYSLNGQCKCNCKYELRTECLARGYDIITDYPECECACRDNKEYIAVTLPDGTFVKNKCVDENNLIGACCSVDICRNNLSELECTDIFRGQFFPNLDCSEGVEDLCVKCPESCPSELGPNCTNHLCLSGESPECVQCAAGEFFRVSDCSCRQNCSEVYEELPACPNSQRDKQTCECCSGDPGFYAECKDPPECVECEDKSPLPENTVYLDESECKCKCDRTLSCEQVALEFKVDVGLYFENDENCGCDCPGDLEADCESRGLVFQEPKPKLKGCRCDCESNPDLPINEGQCPAGLWDQYRCKCDCDGTNALGEPLFPPCTEKQERRGSLCACRCKSEYVVESCPEVDGKTGIFDEDQCECTYPCGPGKTPYFCQENPSAQRYVSCADCPSHLVLGTCRNNVRPCECPAGESPCGVTATGEPTSCCPEGYYCSGSECLPSPPPQPCDPEPQCPADVGYNPLTCRCFGCPSSEAPACPAGRTYDPNTCECCPENSTYSAANSRCICDSGYWYSPEQDKCVDPYDSVGACCVQMSSTGPWECNDNVTEVWCEQYRNGILAETGTAPNFVYTQNVSCLDPIHGEYKPCPNCTLEQIEEECSEKFMPENWTPDLESCACKCTLTDEDCIAIDPEFELYEDVCFCGTKKHYCLPTFLGGRTCQQKGKNEVPPGTLGYTSPTQCDKYCGESLFCYREYQVKWDCKTKSWYNYRTSYDCAREGWIEPTDWRALPADLYGEPEEDCLIAQKFVREEIVLAGENEAGFFECTLENGEVCGDPEPLTPQQLAQVGLSIDDWRVVDECCPQRCAVQVIANYNCDLKKYQIFTVGESECVDSSVRVDFENWVDREDIGCGYKSKTIPFGYCELDLFDELVCPSEYPSEILPDEGELPGLPPEGCCDTDTDTDTRTGYVSINGGSFFWGTGGLDVEVTVQEGSVSANDGLLEDVALVVCGPFNACVPNGTTENYFSDAAISSWVNGGGILCLKTEFADIPRNLICGDHVGMNSYLGSIGAGLSVSGSIGYLFGPFEIDVVGHPVCLGMPCTTGGQNSGEVSGGTPLMVVGRRNTGEGLTYGTVMAGRKVGNGAVFLVADSNIGPTSADLIIRNAVTLLRQNLPLFGVPTEACKTRYECLDYLEVWPGKDACFAASVSDDDSLPTECPECVPTRSRCDLETGECETYYGRYKPMLSLQGQDWYGNPSGNATTEISYGFDDNQGFWYIESVSVIDGGSGWIDEYGFSVGYISAFPTAWDIGLWGAFLFAIPERLYPDPLTVGWSQEEVSLEVVKPSGWPSDGTGAALSPTLQYSTQNDGYFGSDSYGYWTITSITVDAPGSGYSVGDIVVAGWQVGEVAEVDEFGGILSVSVPGWTANGYNGAFYKNGDALMAVHVEQGGAYYNMGNVENCDECDALHQQYLSDPMNEEIFNKNNVSISRLFVEKNSHCSKHLHEHKTNVFWVESGKIMVEDSIVS